MEKKRPVTSTGIWGRIWLCAPDQVTPVSKEYAVIAATSSRQGENIFRTVSAIRPAVGDLLDTRLRQAYTSTEHSNVCPRRLDSLGHSTLTRRCVLAGSRQGSRCGCCRHLPSCQNKPPEPRQPGHIARNQASCPARESLKHCWLGIHSVSYVRSTVLSLELQLAVLGDVCMRRHKRPRSYSA